MMPNGWKLKKLEELTLEKLSYGANSPSCEIKDGGTRYIRITDIDDSGNLNSDTVGIESESYDEYVLKHNDFLFARSGNTVGKTFLYEKDKHPKSAYAGYLIRYRADETKLLPQYLKQYCFSSRYNFWVKSQIRAGAQPNINAKEYGSLELPLPSIQEQRKIAKILSTWDKAISNTKRLIDNSKQQKKALMQQLLTGKKRLLDDSGKPFEGEWEQLHLSDIAKIKKGKALSSKDLEVGEYPVIAGGKTSPYKHSSYTHEKIITVSASGAYAGFVAYHKQKIWASDCSVIEEKQCSDIQFIYQYLLLNQAKIYSFQSGGAQPHIYPKDIEVLKVNLPEIKEQQKIAFVLSNADKEIKLLEQQLADLKQEKKALMQQLLTGKRRVKLDDKEIA
ncbi:restriction endonuclease subunit S [uncultured Pseudoalteromonas sp.]|uniref:restriction endonuclease subunit S n=1 Tax=uncultured Pseudoalteromonas sp. TaxID=114053 RepID=UPI0025921B56|nr:restriction endonuclease subunit S [uncultured Pseudoalteromonas sp.]